MQAHGVIVKCLTRFAIIACLAGAKRGGGRGKKRTRSHQSWPPFFSSSQSPNPPPPYAEMLQYKVARFLVRFTAA